MNLTSTIRHSPSPLRHSRPVRHSREGGNPEHRHSVATEPSSHTPYTKASLPTNNHQKPTLGIGNKRTPSVQLPNARALGPRLREVDEQRNPLTFPIPLFRHSRAGGNPEHQRPTATAQTSPTPHTKAILP